MANKKSIIRSVRFSEEMYEIIEQQVGENFNQKFARMVYNCYMLLPQRQQEAERLAKLIAERKVAFHELGDKYLEYTRALNILSARVKDLASVIRNLEEK